MTYATCFVCNEKGHLSSACPNSTQGIYPNGGCCRICQSIQHLVKDCPDMHTQTENETTAPKKDEEVKPRFKSTAAPKHVKF